MAENSIRYISRESRYGYYKFLEVYEWRKGVILRDDIIPEICVICNLENKSISKSITLRIKSYLYCRTTVCVECLDICTMCNKQVQFKNTDKAYTHLCEAKGTYEMICIGCITKYQALSTYLDCPYCWIMQQVRNDDYDSLIENKMRLELLGNISGKNGFPFFNIRRYKPIDDMNYGRILKLYQETYGKNSWITSDLLELKNRDKLNEDVELLKKEAKEFDKDKMEKEIKILKEEVVELKETMKELVMMIKYMPGSPAYEEVKEHYEDEATKLNKKGKDEAEKN